MWPEVGLRGITAACGFFKGKARGAQLRCDFSELRLVWSSLGLVNGKKLVLKG